MDFGSSLKPPAPTGSLPFQRVETAPRNAVRTELPPAASVQQAGRAEPVRFEPSEGLESRAALDAALRRTLQRSLEVDERTRDVVFRATDDQTGEVVVQLPSEQALKLRAYMRELVARSTADRTA